MLGEAHETRCPLLCYLPERDALPNAPHATGNSNGFPKSPLREFGWEEGSGGADAERALADC